MVPTMSEDRKGRPFTHDWAALQRAWENVTSVTTVTDFAKAHGVSREALTRRMTSDAKSGKPWVLPKTFPENASGSSNVVDLDGRRHKGVRGAGKNGVTQGMRAPSAGDVGGVLVSEIDLAALLNTDGDPLADSTRRSRLAAAAAEGLLLRVMRGQVTPGINQSLADVVDKAVTVLERATKLARMNAGKTEGDVSVETDRDADDNRWEIERRIVGEAAAS